MPRRHIHSCPRTWVGAVALLLSSVGSTSAGAAPATGTASVTILRPVAARQDASLSFGKILPGKQTVVLTIDPDGTTHCSQAESCSGSVSPAVFSLTGSPNERVGVSMIDQVTLLSVEGESLTVALTLGSSQLSLESGQGKIAVGGEITVPAGQAPGNYRGSFQINVEYQ